MLSRANSGAGNRLRRAKSSSSVQQRSYEARTTTQINPKHAELAALEAYRRAYSQVESLPHPETSSKLNRRQSQMSSRSGRSEGSHFEESRNGNRIGAAGRSKGHSKSNSVNCAKTDAKRHVHTLAESGEETIATRSRRAINSDNVPSSALDRHCSLKSDGQPQHHIRKAKSAYYAQTSQDGETRISDLSRKSILYPDTPYRMALPPVTRGAEPAPCTISPLPSIRKPTPREMQVDEDIKVAAWDAYLQDFHQRKVRERKSFIAPIKKRLTKEQPPVITTQYDSSIPPFNSASEADDVFSSSPPPFQANQPLHVTKFPKSRSVSDSLKNKFMRLIGKSKRVQSSLPAQHVEAMHLHFDVSADKGGILPQPGYTLSVPPPHSSPRSETHSTRTRKSSMKSALAPGDAASMTSRVTSWTNSTAAGTLRVSGKGECLSAIDETGMITEMDPETTKSRHSSLFGKTLRLPRRRASRAEIGRSSEDTQQLYDALRKQMEASEISIIPCMESTINSETVATDTVLKEYLPPKREGYKPDLNTVPAFQTIRPVQDEVITGSAPVVEATEPPDRPAPDPPRATRKVSWLGNTRRSAPSQTFPQQSRPQDNEPSGLNTIRPSQDQLTSRLKRSQNRWQSTLQEESPVGSRALRYSLNNENPYKLGSITTTPQIDYRPVAVKHDKSHGKSADQEAPRAKAAALDLRNQVISPSVYSRTTECRSTTPGGGMEQHNTFITITGHEVKRYSLESPSKLVNEDSYVVKPSHEWRNWLSTELRDFDSTPMPDELSQTVSDYLGDLNHAPDAIFMDSNHRCKPAEGLNGGNVLPSSVENPVYAPTIKASKVRRPTLDSRPSSIMNERYPLIETGRESSSDRSIITRNRHAASSKQPSSNPKVLSGRRIDTVSQADDTHSNSTGDMRPRVRERHSAAILGGSRPKISTTQQGSSGTADVDGRGRALKHKSALDLRAVCRNGRSLGASSINVRRKPISVLLQEDQTLRRISQGPYAQSSPINKENATPPIEPITSVRSEPTYEVDAKIPPKCYSRKSPARYSRIRPASGVVGAREKDSPGQRMVDEFLNSRNSIAGPSPGGETGGSSPAFI